NLHETIMIWTTVAGNGIKGSAANQFDHPHGIFVNIKFVTYVADCGNNRIQRFPSEKIDGTPINILFNYSSELTANSPMYYRDCQRPKCYYEIFEINVNTNASYIIWSESTIHTYGYIYKDNFDPLKPSDNQLFEHNGTCNQQQLKFIINLQMNIRYILVVTTFESYTIGKFSLFISGLNHTNVTIKHSNSNSKYCVIVARKRSKAQKNQSLKLYIREQFNEHKQLIISPIVLLALSIPRLIISLLPGCVNASENLCLQLYQWSVHLDLVEEYQAFLENRLDINILTANLTIYNCWIKQKFGRYCQYSFDSQNNPTYAHLFNGSCRNICFEPDIPCTKRLMEYCPSLFEFPALSVGWSDLHFIYGWNRTNTSLGYPNYVCYNERRCSISQLNIYFKKKSESLNLKHRLACTFDIAENKQVKCLRIINVLPQSRMICTDDLEIPHFPTLCNGLTEFEENIETNCEMWQCDNQYTRCDGIWNCPNGEDENNCFHEICNGSIGQPCLLLYTAKYICLPIANISDGIVDCIGATDEQQACRNIEERVGKYRCLTNRTDNKQFANETQQCIHVDDTCVEKSMCIVPELKWSPLCKDEDFFVTLCIRFWTMDRRITEHNIMCSLDENLFFHTYWKSKRPQFSVNNYNIISAVGKSLVDNSKASIVTNRKKSTPLIHFTKQGIVLNNFQCHGGIPIYSGKHITCLCPSFLYGLQCQYQNQRISMTLEIGAPEWRIPFVFVIYLIDETLEIVNSYYQIRYLSIRDCNRKFHFHLLYSTKPKYFDHKYSIRIDVFEMNTLVYRASWLYPILFPILPVYRLSLHLTVPFVSLSSCTLKCPVDRSQCSLYRNINQFVCRCKSGWTGSMCTIPYKCNCSPDSICVGTWMNKSICVCPTYKFGRRCYLKNNLCERSNARKCRNHGQCIPGIVQFPRSFPTICSCLYGFHGELCEFRDSQIDISLHMSNIPDSLLIHFITVNSHMNSLPYEPILKYGPHERATTFKRITFDKNSVRIYWQNPFHFIFVQYNSQIFWIFSQLKYNRSLHLKLTLQSYFRCPSIQENLLNQTILNYPRNQRVKYYHIPCQTNFNLTCFHDQDQYICLCTFDHRANCFTFDHQIKYSCQQLSYCENGGQCFQNNLKCPSSAVCSCPKCYLGTRCQLSTRGFNLPLDVILGYRIRSGQSFSQQPISVQFSGIITMFMFLFDQSNALNLFTSITTVFHIICPFIINIISALGIVLMRIKSRLNLRKDQNIYEHIQNEFHKNKYLIISPIGLIILVLPRIILAFQLECMKPARESVTFYLIGYFISFLPSLSLFIIFILPSRKYRQVFKKSIQSRWKKFSQWIHC
ncbi:hypothetical protein I4U23_022433, partial [Adineta vaga]